MVHRTRCSPASTGTDPFLIADEFLRAPHRLGFSGVQNFPTVGLIDGTFRANLRRPAWGTASRSR